VVAVVGRDDIGRGYARLSESICIGMSFLVAWARLVSNDCTIRGEEDGCLECARDGLLDTTGVRLSAGENSAASGDS
jgi:hypothetical protein